jgi:membrane-bound lytic murein transglycosylase D
MKKLIGFIIIIVLAIEIKVSAQQKQNAEVENSTDILNNLDSLMNLWYLKNTTPLRTKHSTNIYGFKPEEVPVYHDSVYASRIKKISSPLPYIYNDKVRGFIDLYAVRKRDQVEKMLGLSEFYFPIFEEVLDKYNMPLEIKYLSVVESALNPRATSRVGASGLWQFMYATGKLYRLDVSSYIDDRRDPYKSTDAAARYLRDLHNIFGDWFLAIAAYNCGPGNINKAIRRSGGKRTFWEIYNFLPMETRGYVPAFIAASYVFTYHREHNLYPQRPDLPILVDTVVISKNISFAKIAHILNLNVNVIRDLNPSYKNDFIPAEDKNLLLRLPATKAYAFATLKDSMFKEEEIADNIDSHEEAKEVVSTPKTDKENQLRSENKKSESQDITTVTVWYTVKSGDFLSTIADWYDVSIYSIRRWNGLKSNMIPIGKKLKIEVPGDKLSYYKKINNMTALQKRNLDKQNILTETTTAKKEVIQSKQNTISKKTEKKNVFEYYVIQKGDTLWSIAQRFPGVTVADIMRVNGIKDNHAIKVGQKIKIEKGS